MDHVLFQHRVRREKSTEGTESARVPMLKIGQKAPDFTLKTDTGTEVSLQDFKGRRVVIFFFPKANTPG